MGVLSPITSGAKLTALYKKKTILTVKCGGGSGMAWGCYAASGPGQLTQTPSMESSILQFYKEEWVKIHKMCP